MKPKSLLIIWGFLLGLLNCYSQESKIQQPFEDSIVSKIDSIVKFIDSNVFPSAHDENPTAPSGLFAIYRADSLKGELRKAQRFTYQGDICYLHLYYYLNHKLIKVTELRVNLKRKNDKKTNNYERKCYYWNDSLHFAYNPTRETFDSETDLIDAQTILNRFRQKFSSNQLKFFPPIRY